MLTLDYCERVKNTKLGHSEITSLDILSIREYAEKCHKGDEMFYAIQVAYNLGFIRGRRAGKKARKMRHEDQDNT